MSGEKCYRLPVQAMVAVMTFSAGSVLLHTRLPGIQTRLAHLIIKQGALHSCTIIDPTGTVLLQQQDAFDTLLRFGELEWQVTMLPASVTPERGIPGQAAGTGRVTQDAKKEGLSSRIPFFRLTPLPLEDLASLPHALRMTLLLVDGKRSIHEIARLLSKSPGDIQQTLIFLQHLVQL